MSWKLLFMKWLIRGRASRDARRGVNQCENRVNELLGRCPEDSAPAANGPKAAADLADVRKAREHAEDAAKKHRRPWMLTVGVAASVGADALLGAGLLEQLGVSPAVRRDVLGVAFALALMWLANKVIRAASKRRVVVLAVVLLSVAFCVGYLRARSDADATDHFATVSVIVVFTALTLGCALIGAELAEWRRSAVQPWRDYRVALAREQRARYGSAVEAREKKKAAARLAETSRVRSILKAAYNARFIEVHQKNS